MDNDGLEPERSTVRLRCPRCRRYFLPQQFANSPTGERACAECIGREHATGPHALEPRPRAPSRPIPAWAIYALPLAFVLNTTLGRMLWVRGDGHFSGDDLPHALWALATLGVSMTALVVSLILAACKEVGYASWCAVLFLLLQASCWLGL